MSVSTVQVLAGVMTPCLIKGCTFQFQRHRVTNSWKGWGADIVDQEFKIMTTGKTIALTRWTFDNKVMSLLFNMLSRSKHLLISGLQWFWKRKSVTISIVSPSICHEVMGPDAMIFIFWMLSFKPVFHTPLLPSSRGSLVPLCFLPLGWWHPHIWGYWYFCGNLDSNLCFIQLGILHDVLCM